MAKEVVGNEEGAKTLSEFPSMPNDLPELFLSEETRLLLGDHLEQIFEVEQTPEEFYWQKACEMAREYNLDDDLLVGACQAFEVMAASPLFTHEIAKFESEKVRRLDLKKERPREGPSLKGSTFKSPTTMGGAHITINNDRSGRPYEAFVEAGKRDSEAILISAAMGRLVGLILRLPSPMTPKKRLVEVIDQLSGIGGRRQSITPPFIVPSLPNAFAEALALHIGLVEHEEEPSDEAPTKPDNLPDLSLFPQTISFLESECLERNEEGELKGTPEGFYWQMALKIAAETEFEGELSSFTDYVYEEIAAFPFFAQVTAERESERIKWSKETEVKPRPDILKGATYEGKTPLGTAFIIVNDDDEGEPFEVFANVGKAGSITCGACEALGRLFSLTLRMPSSMAPKKRLAKVIDELIDIGVSRPSLHQELAKILARHIGRDISDAIPEGNQADVEVEPVENNQVELALCPNCGENTYYLNRDGQGCFNCNDLEQSSD